MGIYICLQAWNGFLAAFAYNIRSVFFTELHSEKFRYLGSTMCCLGFACAWMLMPLIAYVFPYWRDQLYCYTIIFGLFSVFYFMIKITKEILESLSTI